MINTVKTSAALGDPRDDQPPPRRQPEAPAEAKPAKAKTIGAADVRLVIEGDEAAGGLIYKLIDRATGAVISTVSRADLMRMSVDPAYTAGRVISTQA